MIKRIILLVVVILVVLAAYIAYQVKKLMNYCYVIDYSKTRIKKVSLDLIDIDMCLKFKNRSDIDIHIKKYVFDIFVNDHKVGTVLNKQKQILRAGGFSDFIIGINFSLKEALSKGPGGRLMSFQNIMNLLSDKKNIKITIRGDVYAGVVFYTHKLPIDITYSLEELMAPSTTPTEKCE